MDLTNQAIIGVDLGGTKIHAARIHEARVEASVRQNFSANGNEEQVLTEIIEVVNQLNDGSLAAIGIGVPGLVDLNHGLVLDVVNIPSWKNVPLQAQLEQYFEVPVFINNDANCFALGEKYFGHGRQVESLVGLTLGTGMGAGIVINGKLYCGTHCGAGEFGMLPYLNHNYEFYCSGQFFRNVYGLDGHNLFDLAKQGDPQALKIFNEFGHHLGMALTAIFYALAPQMIVLGGSVSKSFPFFEKAMRRTLQKVEYQSALQEMQIVVSNNPEIPVLGAAALALQSEKLNVHFDI